MQKLLTYISHPEQLNRNTLDELLKIKEAYPYFQTVHLLTLKNRQLTGEAEITSEVESIAAYVTDRKVLYDLLFPLEKMHTDLQEDIVIPPGEMQVVADEPTDDTVIEISADVQDDSDKKVIYEEKATESKTPETKSPLRPVGNLRDNISNLLSWQMEELELMDPSDAELVPEIAVDIDKEYGSKSAENEIFTLDVESEGIAEEVPPDQHVLIDKFIENNPRLEAKLTDGPNVDISEDSVKENDGIFTDTLARIYIKQGYYSKAIFAYEKLILKYPEKSDYFAGQIEMIKKLTNKQ